MMSLGQGITLFLIDGAPDGRITCELFNWTGKGYKIPRRMVKQSIDRRELYKAGVYFLFGHDDDPSGMGSVYIGEAEEVLQRIGQHGDKEFWNEVVLFISKDENLNKAHIKYLEYELYSRAKEVGRYKVTNGTTPNKPAISEMEQAVMSQFADHLKLLIGTMGYKLFEPLVKNAESNRNLYYIVSPRGARAEGIYSNDGMIVLKDSIAIAEEYTSLSPRLAKQRLQMLEDGSLIQENGGLVFCKDCLFSSPSSAASFILG